MRHRTGQYASLSSSSSEDEEDVFNKTKVNKRQSNSISSNNSGNCSSKKLPEKEDFIRMTNMCQNDKNNTNKHTIIATGTSHTKRHHYQNHPNSSRAAKMEAMIHQLEMDSQDVQRGNISSSHRRDNVSKSLSQGSYCINAYEEQITTNIFVGNLSPLITEEDLHQIFSQYGTLYSVKIMWPRNSTMTTTTSSSSHTGFVCFMERQDAQKAMDHLDNVDIRNTGRRIYLNWGKPQLLPKNDNATNDIMLTTTLMTNPITADVNLNESTSIQVGRNTPSISSVPYNAAIHANTAIRIKQPSDPKRCQFIDTIAFHVAQDGSALEDRLRQDVISDAKHHPYQNMKEYGFLYPWTTVMQTFTAQDDFTQDILKQECLYYRWRLYMYTQEALSQPYHHSTRQKNDTWRTEPFQMFHQGPFWIPPPLPTIASSSYAELSQEQNEMFSNDSHNFQNHRHNRSIINKRGYLKQSKSNRIEYNIGPDGRIELTNQDMVKWKEIMDNLIGSKECICHAMAFCFDRSAAAAHVSSMLKDTLLDNRKGVSIDTKCARLFLLSDVLYNSQQPGVKNAFQFRTSIEGMAREVFQNLGQSNKNSKGRMTMNKLRNAVRAVLSAWNDWSVFVPEFLDELESLFEGRDLANEPKVDEKVLHLTDHQDDIKYNNTSDEDVTKQDTFTYHVPSSIWMDVDHMRQEDKSVISTTTKERSNYEHPVDEYDDFKNAHLIDEDLDGESLGNSEIDEDHVEYLPGPISLQSKFTTTTNPKSLDQGSDKEDNCSVSSS
jgi:U2-associated protein SR140